MAAQKSIFSQLKEIGKSLDRRIPALQHDLENPDRSEDKAIRRNGLLMQLQDDVNFKKKDAMKLSRDIKKRGDEFARFLELAKVTVQQQGQQIQQLQAHLQKYGYELPKKAEEVKETADDGNEVQQETATSPKDAGDGQALKSPPKLVHCHPVNPDHSPTLEDYGLHPNFMENIKEIVANRVANQKYGEGGFKQPLPPKSEQREAESKTPYFANGAVVVTPGMFDGRDIPDTGKSKYLESPPALGSDPFKCEESMVQDTPRWRGFQTMLMEETPLPRSVEAKRVANATNSASFQQEVGSVRKMEMTISPELRQATTAVPTRTEAWNSTDSNRLSSTPPTPEVLKDFGRTMKKEIKASEENGTDNKKKKKSGSLGTPPSPVFMTPAAYKLKKAPAMTAIENEASPATPVFLTPALNKTKSLPALNRVLEDKGCGTPETPECMKVHFDHTILMKSVTKSYTTDDIPDEEQTVKTPEMPESKQPVADGSPQTPQMLFSNIDEIKRKLRSYDMNKKENVGSNQVAPSSSMMPFGSNIKVRTGVTPCVPKASQFPYITPGKENRTLNFTGIQPEFNLIVEPITEQEFSNLPTYQRKQFTFSTLNKVVEKINALLEDKLANDLPLELAEEEVINALGPSAFTLLMIMSCLGRVDKRSIQGKLMYTVL